MNPLKTTTKFKMAGPDGKPVKWKIEYTTRLKTEAMNYAIERAGEVLYEQDIVINAAEIFTPIFLEVKAPEGDLEFEIGWINLFKVGAVIRHADKIIHKTHNKPFRGSGKMGAWLEKMEAYNEEDETELTDKQKADLERTKEMGPEIMVDIAMGIFFFFFARD